MITVKKSMGTDGTVRGLPGIVSDHRGARPFDCPGRLIDLLFGLIIRVKLSGVGCRGCSGWSSRGHDLPYLIEFVYLIYEFYAPLFHQHQVYCTITRQHFQYK